MKNSYIRRLQDYEKDSPWHKFRFSLIKKFLIYQFQNKKKPISVIDIGCGTGEIMCKISEEKFVNNVQGIDLNEVGLEICKQKGINAKYGDIQNFEMSKKTFDVVLCLDVFYSKKIDIKRSLINIKKILENDSIIIINSAALGIFSGVDDFLDDGGRRINKREFNEIIYSLGYSIIDSFYWNYLLSIPLILLRKLELILLPKNESRIAKLSSKRIFNSLIFKIFLIEAFLYRAFKINPFGASYFAVISLNNN